MTILSNNIKFINASTDSCDRERKASKLHICNLLAENKSLLSYFDWKTLAIKFLIEYNYVMLKSINIHYCHKSSYIGFADVVIFFLDYVYLQ